VSATTVGVVERDSVEGAGPTEVSTRNDSRLSDFPVTNRGPESFQRFQNPH
jgi:hypothetical protein